MLKVNTHNLFGVNIQTQYIYIRVVSAVSYWWINAWILLHEPELVGNSMFECSFNFSANAVNQKTATLLIVLPLEGDTVFKVLKSI